MSTYTSYNQVGLKENVDDLISNISPFSTPMQAMIKNEKVNARTFSFLEDSLADSMVNAQVEGADSSMLTLTDATERTNNTQIMSKAFQISATADAVATYGRAKETALQLAKKLKEIKKDYEHAMVGVTQVAVAGSASTARTRCRAATIQEGSARAFRWPSRLRSGLEGSGRTSSQKLHFQRS